MNANSKNELMEKAFQLGFDYEKTYMTLFPGDIVTTGTPKGIAPMQPGDTVVVEIEGIGCLRNRVQPDPAGR